MNRRRLLKMLGLAPMAGTVATYGGVPGNSLVEMDCIAYIPKK